MADLERERAELIETPRAELSELAGIYERRGVSPALAHQVAEELTAHDPLEAHARDELGLDLDDLARPVQAAATSAVSFALGALVPLLVALVVTSGPQEAVIIAVTLVWAWPSWASPVPASGERTRSSQRPGWWSAGRWPWPSPSVSAPSSTSPSPEPGGDEGEHLRGGADVAEAAVDGVEGGVQVPVPHRRRWRRRP